LPVAHRHHKARLRGAKAISLLKDGKTLDAIKHLMEAFIIWPPLAIDLRGFFLAIKKLINRNDDPVFPIEWPV
jgi:hypothetical protein